jgi:hypothetical protein
MATVILAPPLLVEIVAVRAARILQNSTAEALQATAQEIQVDDEDNEDEASWRQPK